MQDADHVGRPTLRDRRGQPHDREVLQAVGPAVAVAFVVRLGPRLIIQRDALAAIVVDGVAPDRRGGYVVGLHSGVRIARDEVAETWNDVTNLRGRGPETVVNDSPPVGERRRGILVEPDDVSVEGGRRAAVEVAGRQVTRVRVPGNQIAVRGIRSADRGSYGSSLREADGDSGLVGRRGDAGRIRADKVTRDDHAGRAGAKEVEELDSFGAAVDDETPHRRVAGADRDAAIGGRGAVDLDLEHGVQRAGGIRVRGAARLRVAVDRQGLADDRQQGEGRDRVHARSRDGKGDRVRSGGGLRVEDRLA